MFTSDVACLKMHNAKILDGRFCFFVVTIQNLLEIVKLTEAKRTGTYVVMVVSQGSKCEPAQSSCIHWFLFKH